MSYASYLLIWVWLIALLIAGTLVSYLPLSKTGIALLILAIALAKAVLVALFYMHLKFERLALWAVALFPFFLIGLAVLLVTTGWIAV
jgi:cytochrome c oxidase subunit 4